MRFLYRTEEIDTDGAPFDWGYVVAETPKQARARIFGALREMGFSGGQVIVLDVAHENAQGFPFTSKRRVWTCPDYSETF